MTMEQYILKSVVLTEIENLLDKGKYHEEYDCAYRDGNNGALYALKSKLNTFEVKEVGSNEAIIEKAAKYIANHFLAPGMDNEINDFINYMKGK